MTYIARNAVSDINIDYNPVHSGNKEDNNSGGAGAASIQV